MSICEDLKKVLEGGRVTGHLRSYSDKRPTKAQLAAIDKSVLRYDGEEEGFTDKGTIYSFADDYSAKGFKKDIESNSILKGTFVDLDVE